MRRLVPERGPEQVPARVPAPVVDAALALVFVAVNTWELLTPTDDGLKVGGLVGNLVVLDLFAAVLVLRRRFPLLCWTTMHVEFLLAGLLVRHGGFAWGTSLPACITTYTVARYAERRWGWIALASGPLLLLGLVEVVGWTPRIEASAPFFVVSSVIAWAVGRVLRRLGERESDLQDARDRLLAEQHRREVTAAAEERARISLEMHDVVAVAVEAMTARLAAETRALAEAGDDVTRLTAAQEAGRQALADLSRTVGGLRPADQSADRVPSLLDADTLVASVRGTGREVRWRADAVDLLPTPQSFAAYRILQEALTNALKHGTGLVDASVEVVDHTVVVRVVNAVGPPRPSAYPSGRHGLVGMSTRVGAFGGTLEAGPTSSPTSSPTSGPTGTAYLVTATLPVPVPGPVAPA